MTAALVLSEWWQAIALVALEVTVIVVAVASFQRLSRSPEWHRILWQIGILAIVGITVAELTGMRGALGRLAVAASQRALLPREAKSVVPTFHSVSAGEPQNGMVDQLSLGANAAAQAPASPKPITKENLSGAEEGDFELSGLYEGRRLRLGSREVSQVALTPPKVHFLPALIWITGSSLFFARLFLLRLLFLLATRREATSADGQVIEYADDLRQRLGMKRPVRVLQSSKFLGPMAFGIFRGSIGLPADFQARFTGRQQQTILAHELAHLAFKDPAWHLLIDSVTALLWWHPLVWWARGQFQYASEALADEASLLVANGPAALAESLVQVGWQLQERRSLGWNAMAGNGFRSALGKRVQRLVQLEGKWKPPTRIRNRSFNVAGSLILVAAIALSTVAFDSHQPSTEGKAMKQFESSWKKSLVGLALLTALNFDSPANPPYSPAPDLAAQKGSAADAAAREEFRRVFKAELEVEEPTGSSIKQDGDSKPSPTLAPTPYQLDPELARRYGLPTGTNRSEPVAAKLEAIVLDEFFSDDLPLSEIVRDLYERSRKLDATGEGVNFLVNHGPDSQIRNSIIRISPPLQNIRLRDLLDAIVKMSEQPIQYTIEPYGVLFGRDLPQSAETDMTVHFASPLRIRTFHVLDYDHFFDGMRQTFDLTESDLSNKPPAHAMKEALSLVLTDLGIDMSAEGKSVFYNPLTKIIMVRAADEDMGIIEAVIETLAGRDSSGGDHSLNRE